VGSLLDPSHQLVAGIYRMTFQTAEYWAATGVTGYFYPYVQVKERDWKESKSYRRTPTSTLLTMSVPNRSSLKSLQAPRSNITISLCF